MQRASFVGELFKGFTNLVVTDYSSFEIHFKPQILKNLELHIFKYLLQNYPKEYYLNQVVLGLNKVRGRLLSY